MTVGGYYNRREISKAGRELTKRVELEPQNPEAQYTLAKYVLLGQGVARTSAARRPRRG